jgi:drug/metabolite transporter (DMT)-like permease
MKDESATLTASVRGPTVTLAFKEVTLWVIEGLGSALTESICNAGSHQLGHRWSLEAIVWWQRAVAFLFVVTFALLWHGAPTVPEARHWILPVVSFSLNAYASLLYVRALREDLSLTVPITALSPVCLLATEPLMSGRFIPGVGVLGVGIICLGLYVLNLDALRAGGLLGPIRDLWRRKGTRLLLVVIVIWSVTAPIDSIAVHDWDPLWYAAVLHGGSGLLLTPFCWRKSQALKPARGDRFRLAAIGVLSGLGTMLQLTAMVVAPATAVIAMRRFSAPLSGLWGWLFFHEPHIRSRLLGAFVMAIGAAIMLTSL